MQRKTSASLYPCEAQTLYLWKKNRFPRKLSKLEKLLYVGAQGQNLWLVNYEIYDCYLWSMQENFALRYLGCKYFSFNSITLYPVFHRQKVGLE